MASNLYYSSDFHKLSFGDKGLRIIAASATSTAGENFCAIQAVEASTISCDIDTTGGDASITSLALGAGSIIYGNFDDVSVASGKVICYLR
jgi:ethanolamine utilization microcompartment shell protein EutS